MWIQIHKSLNLQTSLVTWTSSNDRVQHITNTAETKVAVSLHLHHAPQAVMLECRLEILSTYSFSEKTYTFEYAAPRMGVSTMMYWQMTHIWWLL
jgi:hypothetical protein